ncbi:unnamed protein product [Staurois parvus]|uniref:Ig-like domain-containing protein n=1 Tax=Staurois parvus TaxID=386267 RepID=A0ABN9CB17_9NEOB|nr:unnamed protein product [Staurois parvus]
MEGGIQLPKGIRAEDGVKYIEKILVKHKEAINSVNDLCIYLKELEEKLEEPQKVPENSISEEHAETTDPLLSAKDDTAKTCQRHTVTQEATKSVSEKHSNVSPAGQSPGFSKHLSNVTVKEGSPVTLEVEVTGYPEPTLTWWVAYNQEKI